MTEIKLNSKIATINIADETKIIFPDKYNSIAIRTDSEIGISPLPNKNIGDENVLRCKANESTVFSGVYNTYIYLIGTGTVEIILGNNFNFNPFKVVGGSGGGGGTTPILINKTITENGIYNASADSADGYNKVNVNVQSNVDEISVNANGVYNASDENLDGFSRVTVDVEASPVLDTKNIIENGIYTALDEGLDGFSEVTVDVPFTIDYVDNNKGVIFLSQYNDFTHEIWNYPFNIARDEDITIELCMNVTSGRTHYGRYFDGASIIIADAPDNGKYYLEMSVNNQWQIEYDSGDRIELPQDADYTLSFRITENGTDIFINGELYLFTDKINNSDLISCSRTSFYLFDSSASNRMVQGRMYAFRVYSRALTDEEIMHNHQEDLKIIQLYGG